MTEAEFSRHMNRLIAQFGKTAYSTERVALVWREVQSLDASWWNRTVDKMLGECRQAPLLPEIRDAVSNERERNWQQKKTQALNLYDANQPVRCRMCKDTGVVLAIHKESGPGPYVFKCQCDSGRRDGRRYQTWPPMNGAEFEVCSA